VGSNDIDGGVTSIRSPAIALPSGGGLTLSFSYYLAHLNNATSADFLRVQVVGSTTATVLEELGAGNTDAAAWATASADISAFAGQSIRILISAADAGGGSLVEAGIDDVRITQP
jgi:aminopeptidase S